VVALRQFGKQDTMKTVGIVRRAIEEFNAARVHVDVVGIGAGVVDRLHELGLKRKVHGVNVGENASDTARHANLRAEIYDNLRQRFEEETISIPNNPDLVSELAAIRMEFTSKGQLRLEPKESMRRRHRSPDMADALALAFMPSKDRPRHKAPWWRGLMFDEDVYREYKRKKEEAAARGEEYVEDWEKE
jgi:hypothetical protein